ncbi:MAG: hypothetical protein DRN33_04515 [Thermoplasmata archaeon]|nr:MAG: hypothetical protein DRN33_04515 [Thermoplasmata archaeon]
MLMVYDGNKSFFLESVEKGVTLTAELFYNLVNSRVRMHTIFVECATVPSGDTGMMTVFVVPYGTVPEDKHVLLDYTKINAVWVKDFSEEEAKDLNVLQKFVKPVQDKFEKLAAEQEQKAEADFNTKVAHTVSELIEKAKRTAAQDANAKAAMDSLEQEMDNTVSFETVPAQPMPDNISGAGTIPAFGTPAAAAESVSVQQMSQVHIPQQ